MKTLVAGATGALGLQLVRVLLERDHTVVGTSTTEGGCSRLRDLGAQASLGDVLDKEQIKGVVDRAAPDAVVHLATRLPKAGPRRLRDMRTTNLLRRVGNANLVSAAENADVDRYVGESMMFIYGYVQQKEKAVENQRPADGQSSGLQEVTEALVASESQIADASARGTLEGVSLRFGLLHSAEAGSTREMARLIDRRRFPLIGGGKAIHSWIALKDAALATALVVESDSPSSIYNVVDDEPVRFNDYVAEIVRLRGAKAPRTMPSWLVRPFASYATAFLADVELPVSNSRIKAELNWRPTFPTYREALAPFEGARL